MRPFLRNLDPSSLETVKYGVDCGSQTSSCILYIGTQFYDCPADVAFGLVRFVHYRSVVITIRDNMQ